MCVMWLCPWDAVMKWCVWGVGRQHRGGGREKTCRGQGRATCFSTRCAALILEKSSVLKRQFTWKYKWHHSVINDVILAPVSLRTHVMGSQINFVVHVCYRFTGHKCWRTFIDHSIIYKEILYVETPYVCAHCARVFYLNVKNIQHTGVHLGTSGELFHII